MIFQLLPFKDKIPQLLCLSLSTSKPTQIKLFKIIRKFRIFQSCDTFCIGHILTPFFYTSCICFVCDTFCIGHPMPLCTVGSGSTQAGSPQKIKEILYFGKKKEASTQMQTINFKNLHKRWSSMHLQIGEVVATSKHTGHSSSDSNSRI